ncbi:MAG: FAD-dependent oxidoreductase [Pseudomonadota bacterium]
MPIATDARSNADLHCDVAIVGGGAAGVATAVTAAKQGMQVVLVERHGFCGGGAVAGHSGTVCGLYEASENPSNGPVQAVFGFTEKFIVALNDRGGLGDPVRYGKTFTRVHDPIVWRETADAFLADQNITTIYHAVATRVLSDVGERIEGVELWTKQGPLRVRAKVTVDASGDADLIAMAGLPNTIGDNGRVQNPTMIFRLMGVDVPAFLEAYGEDTIMPVEVSEQIVAANASGAYTLPRAKIWLFPTTRPNELLCNCTRVIGADGRELNPLFWRDFSAAETEGRKQAREYARFFADTLTGCENAFLNDMAVQVGVRQTRQIDGVQTLQNADILAGQKFGDGIARSPWPIELHSGERPKVEWLLNDVYEIPYGCFVPERGEGLLAAGRCLSAEHEAVASARVTAQCFSYGQAIGHAASIAVHDNIAPRAINGTDLRDVLNRDGARLNG